MRRVIAPLILLAGAAAIAAAPVAAGYVPTLSTPQKKKVLVADNYFGPAKLTVNRGSTIKWVWPYDNGNTHDVKLSKKHPVGAKTFHSEPATAGFSYTRKLTVPGTYLIVCTLHTTMKMTIVVRK